MATINLTYDTGNVPLARIYDAFATAYGWTATVPNGAGGTIPNPETKAQHARRRVGEYVRDVVKSQERETARRTAEDAVGEIQLA